MPPQILADQKAPLAGGGSPHYYVPPQIFRLWHVPETRSILYKFVLFEVAMNFGIVYKGCCDILGGCSDLIIQKFVHKWPQIAI